MLRPPLPCFKVFIRAGRFLRSNEEGRLLSMNVRTDEAAAERQRNVIAHRTSWKEGREKLVEGCKTTACSAAFYAPFRTFNLTGLVGSRSIVYNGAVRGRLRVYEPKCRCNDRNVLSMRAHRSLHSGGTNPDGAAQAGTGNEHRVGRQLFQTEAHGVSLRKPEGTHVIVPDFANRYSARGKTPDGLLHSGVEAGVFWHGGRQLRIPYGIRPAPGLPARKPKDAPAAAQGLRFIKWRTHDGLHSAICFTARHDHAGVR